MISRLGVINHIRNKYANSPSLKVIDEAQKLFRLLQTDEAANKMVVSLAKTPLEGWLNILSHSDFYICLPGVRMPWSHNAVEAMSVGSIPIIQYGTLFHPPLQHLKNCIAYQSLDELDAALQTALHMDKTQIDMLRENVTAYYNQYLSAESVINKIHGLLDSKEEKLTVVIPYLEDPVSKKPSSNYKKILWPFSSSLSILLSLDLDLFTM